MKLTSFRKGRRDKKNKVEVFYKKHETSFSDDIYEKITEFEVGGTSIFKILEKVYREMNIAQGREDERVYRLKARSMSGVPGRMDR